MVVECGGRRKRIVIGNCDTAGEVTARIYDHVGADREKETLRFEWNGEYRKEYPNELLSILGEKPRVSCGFAIMGGVERGDLSGHSRPVPLLRE